MFKLKFGFLWLCIINIIFIPTIAVPPEVRNGEPVTPFLFLIFMLFEGIGIWTFVSGLKTVIADRKTDKYGELAFGRIINIFPTGARSNNVPELAAEIIVYNPKTKDKEFFKEIIGIGTRTYVVGMYLLLKKFETDVNIIQIIQESSVPTDILEAIKTYPTSTDYPQYY